MKRRSREEDHEKKMARRRGVRSSGEDYEKKIIKRRGVRRS